jgi:hypothetical protein
VVSKGDISALPERQGCVFDFFPAWHISFGSQIQVIFLFSRESKLDSNEIYAILPINKEKPVSI